MKMLFEYLKHKWIVFSIIIAYSLLLIINALGWQVWLPSCFITQISGVECFGCGISRAVIALLKGNVHDAFNFNPLIFIYLPIILFWVSNDLYKFYLKFNQSYYEKY